MTDPMETSTEAASWWRRLTTRLRVLWQRFVLALQGPESTLPRPSGPLGRLSERRSITPLAVPARGLAFDFQVCGMFIWNSEGLERRNLHSLVEHFLPYARQHLKYIATGLARGVEPHRAEDFEKRLRRHLAELGDWTYERHDLRVTCRVYARVHLDERVREHIRPYWEKMISLDYDRDVASRRARHVDGVSRQWAAILEKLMAGPLPDGAASMTDQELATVVKELIQRRADEARSFEDAVNNLGSDSEYAREGYFDLLSERRDRPSAA